MKLRVTHLWIIILIFLLLLGTAGCAALPQSPEQDGKIFPALGQDLLAAGQEIDNDIVLTGTDVVVEGTVNGDLLAIGNTVTINGPVSGSVIALGQQIVVNSEIGGSLYSVGQNLELGSNAVINHNAHFIGLLLVAQPGSMVGRDLVAFSLRARIGSDIGRSLSGFILLMTLNGRIGFDPDAPESTDYDGTSAPVGARLFGDQRFFISFTGADQGVVSSPRLVHQNLNRPEAANKLQSDLEKSLPDWVVARLTELIVLLVVGFFILWVFPEAVKRPSEHLHRHLLPAVGYGTLGIVIAINLIAIAILLIVALLMFGIWLGTVIQWNLAFIVWGVGYPALLLAFALFALAVLVGTKVILADLVGTLIFEKLAPKANKFRILPFLLGISLYILMRTIPTFGLVLDVIVTILGLGAIWLAICDHRLRAQKMALEEFIPEGTE